MGNLQADEKIPRLTDYSLKHLKDTDCWILSRFTKLIQSVSTNLDKYDYLNPARDLKKFYWEEFCDWYLEAWKVENQDTENNDYAPEFLAWLFFEILSLVHPLCPFVTEKLYKEFWGEKESIFEVIYKISSQNVLLEEPCLN